MSLHRPRREKVPVPERRVPPPVLLVNPGSDAQTATVIVDGGDERPTDHLVQVEARESATVSLPDCDGRVIVECHLDGARASAVVSVDPTEDEGPVLSLLDSTVVVAR